MLPWMCRHLAVALGVLIIDKSSAFVPFGDLEELKPKPLAEHCDPEVKTGIRHCKGETHKTLEDGGVVLLTWEMHADPDRILSVDTELHNGVKIHKCTASSLELLLPESHVWHARVGQTIVASHFAHRCEHLYNVVEQSHKEQRDADEPINHNLYHRVTKVVSTTWYNEDGSLAAGNAKGKHAHVKLWTKELPTIGHAVPTIAYEFKYLPLEAMDPSPYPERHTWDEEFQNDKWVDEKPEKDAAEVRRLQNNNAQYTHQAGPPMNAAQFIPPGGGDFSGTNSGKGYKLDGGAPIFSGTTIQSDDVKSVLNLKPRKVANFAWNWDFRMNSSRNKEYSYTLPGSKMFLLINRPFLKAHSIIVLKFRSYTPNAPGEGQSQNQDAFFGKDTWTKIRSQSSSNTARVFGRVEPRVKWIVQMKGHGVMKAKVLAQMKEYMDLDSNPLKMVQFPILKNFWKPKWFGTLNFAIAQFPISLTPGIQFKAKFFHYGIFRGSFGIGIDAHAVYDPILEFDSFTGVRAQFQMNIQDMTLTPPNWMVSTTHFECGVAFEPTLWIKGQIGHQLRDTKAAVALRPYFNMTITRSGHHEIGGNENKELVLYPFRIVGLNTPDYDKMYQVKIMTRMIPNFMGHQMNTIAPLPWLRQMSTTPAYNWGEVEFQDHVSKWSFGLIPQDMLLKLYIDVQLVELDKFGKKTFSAPVTLRCQSITNGICNPAPMVASIPWNGNKVQVYLHGLWQDSPAEFLQSRLRGLSASFEEVIINKKFISDMVPGYSIDQYVGTGRVSGAMASKPMILVLEHGFKSYPVHLDTHKGYVPNFNSSSLKSTQILELGASFLSTWQTTCAVNGVSQCDPKVILYIGEKPIAHARLPAIPWNSAYRESLDNRHAEATQTTVFSGKIVPITVALRPNSNYQQATQGNVGLAHMRIRLGTPANWDRFYHPHKYTNVIPGETYQMVWTITNPYLIAIGEEIKFRIRFFKNTRAPAKNIYVDANGRPELVPQMGKVGFEEMYNLAKDVSIVAQDTDPNQLGGDASITRPRFEHQTAIGNDYSVGDVWMAAVEWTDQLAMRHVLYTYPVPVVTAAHRQRIINIVAAERANAAKQTAKAIAIGEGAAAGVAADRGGRRLEDAEEVEAIELDEEERRLWQIRWPWQQPLSTPVPGMAGDTTFNSIWQHHLGVSAQSLAANADCLKKDLNFAFGAGVLWRVWVNRLSLPANLPILGGIQDAPLMGTQWAPLGPTWQSTPQDMKDKLPSLLCRNGVCSATLPGCPGAARNSVFYPQIDITFAHTWSYDGINDTKLADVMQNTFAYAFAVLPEAIHLILHYTNATGTHNVNLSFQPITPAPSAPTGMAACEGKFFNQAQCAQVGCCVWQAVKNVCESGVGTGICQPRPGGGLIAIKYDGGTSPAAPTAVPAVPVVTTAPVAPLVTTAPAVVPAVTVAPSVAPATAPATVAPVTTPVLAATTAAPAVVATTAAAASATTATTPPPPMVTVTIGATVGTTTQKPAGAVTLFPPGVTAAPGPTIQPLGGGRRLKDESREKGSEKPRRHVHQVSLSFKEGLRYQVDRKLIDLMIKQGQLTRFFEDDYGPLQVLSYNVREMGPPPQTEKEQTKAEAEAVPIMPISLFVVIGSALTGVAALLLRRHSHKPYTRVEEEPAAEDSSAVE